MTEIALQHLIGKQVFGQDGRAVGRIEEVVAETAGTELLIKEYHLGSFALVERLSSGEMGRALLRLIGATRGEGLAVPWDMMDLSSPSKPRVTCCVEELRPPEREAFGRF